MSLEKFMLLNGKMLRDKKKFHDETTTIFKRL